MKAKNSVVSVFVLCALLSQPLLGATVTARMKAQRASASAPVVLGQWHAGFSTVKAYAEKNGLPLLAVWSNGEDCSHCKKLEKNLLTSQWKEYMQSSGVVYYFGCNEDTSQDDKYGGTGYNWCWKNKSLTLFPFVRFYWKAKKGTRLADGTVLSADTLLVDTAMTGDAFDNYKDVSNKGYSYCISKAKKLFAKYAYAPETGEYFGGEFGYADSPMSRLQAEVDLTTDEVTVPLTRTNASVQAQCYTNYLVATYPAGTSSTIAAKTFEIAWDAGEIEKTVDVPLPTSAKDGYSAGKSITLVLTDAKKVGVATNHIAFVATQETTPANPRWIGEKTKDALGWGEWTMDLGVATNKVRTAGGTATIVLMSGSQWCPDCVATEKWILDTDEFKNWVKTSKIACVAVDLPKVDETGPSLLKYESYRTDTESVRYCSYNYSAITNDDLRVTGGAGYLSRHMVAADDAEEIAARNWNLFTNAVPNGMCRPECLSTSNAKTGKFKTGIPALIVLRPDGTVAGRVYQLNNKSPSKNAPEFVGRLKEIVAQIGDEEEESNDDSSTTAETIGTRETVSGKTISASDATDYYRLDAQAKDQLMTFRLKGADPAEVTLSLVSRTDKSGLELKASSTGNWTDETGLVISYKVPNTNCYVCVSYPVDKNGYAASDSPFAFDSAADTHRTYTLSTDIVLVPGDDGQPADYTIADFDENPRVTVRLQEGQAYKITNLDTSDAAFATYLYAGKGSDVYIARNDADAEIKFTQASFTYQKWVTGQISFDPVAVTASESDVFFWLEVARTGGTSGEGRAQVWLDSTSTNHSDLVVFPSNGTNLVWEAGETGAKRLLVMITDNPYSDGTQRVRFYLSQSAGTSDVGLGASEFILTLVDNDAAKPGKIGLEAVSPLPCAAGKIVVRAGSDSTLEATRSGGTTGTVKGSVKAKTGEVDVEDVEFAERSDQPVQFTYTAPSKAGVTDYVTITGKDGTKVDSSARQIKVQTVAANAPQFLRESLVVTGTRYVPLTAATVGVDPEYDEAEGAYSVSKTYGSLPSGVKAVFSGETLTFSGVPKQAGLFVAAYQLKKGSVAGLTLEVAIYVEDVTVAPSWSQSGQPLNPSVKTTRTFSDIMVVDAASKRLVGLLTVTLPPTGKASAQYRAVDAGTIRFATGNWLSIGDDGSLKAELAATTAGYSELKFTVTAFADGKVAVSGFDEGYEFIVPNDAYSSAHPAKDFQSLYTVSLKPVAEDGTRLARGDGFVTLNLASASKAKTGLTTYAGLLPNGVSFSGSAKLAPYDWDSALSVPDWAYARLPLYLRTTSDRFSGVLKLERKIAEHYGEIMQNVCTRCVVRHDDGAEPQWIHANPKTDGDAYGVSFKALGGKYVPSENLAELIGDNANALSFFAIDPAGMGETLRYGTPQAWSTDGYGISVTYDAKKKVNVIKAKSKTAGFTFVFDSATGVIRGSSSAASGAFRLPTDLGYAPMNFRAVVMPGWGSSNCISCGGSEEATERPFICGAAWTTDYIAYEDALGKTRSAKAQRGCAVSVGTAAGQ